MMGASRLIDRLDRGPEVEEGGGTQESRYLSVLPQSETGLAFSFKHWLNKPTLPQGPQQPTLPPLALAQSSTVRTR